ncbi:WD40 repeat domain-containing protein [Nostoc sp.]|uniref:WD40 repeat domain-containing protein n=1 Tax=Nostoc sp. TaxID=1180 RepID=UPI002FF466E2
MFNKSKESLPLAKAKRHLADNCEQQRLIALEQALTLGQQGLDLLTQQALQDNSEKIRQSAYWILHQHNPYLCKNSGEIRSNKPIFPTDTIACVAISPDNQILVGGSWQKIWVWNLQTGELLRTIDAHSHWVLSVAINRDGNTLVSSSADTTIKVWDLSKGSLIREINAHSNWVNAAEITPDGKTLVSASADKTIKVWDLNTGKLQHTLKNHSGSVLSLAISPDGKFIASGSTDKMVKLWNLQSGELERTLEEHLDWVQAVKISQDSRFLISGSRDGDIKIWQVLSNTENESKSDSNSDNISLISKIIGFIFLIVISKLTAGAVFWIGLPFLSLGDLISKKNKQTHTLNISKLKCSYSIHQELTDTVNNLVISHDGKNLISASNDNAKQWCIETKQLVRTLTGHSGFVSSAAISPDGKIFATASNDWIKLWNLHTGQLLHPLKGSAESRLSHISIFPLQVQLECGQCQTFIIKGIDQNGLDISVQELSWQAERGNIDNSGLFIAGEEEGEFTVTTTAGSFQTSASVTIIEPSKLAQLIITPQEIKLECGQVQAFNIRGLDQRCSEIGVEKLLWQATGGTIDDHGTFHAGQNPGEFAITANLEAVKTSVSVTLIEPVKLKTLIIFPLKSTLTFGESLHFTIKGVDQYGSDIKLEEVTWSATGSTIFSDGRLQASYQEQEISVTASVGEISTSRTINIIEPARLTTLVISRQEVEMKPGEHQHFSIQGLDQRGNAIATEKIAWNATGGKIDQDGNFIVNQNAKGDFSISACAIEQNVSAFAKVVVPVVLQRLEIFPKDIQIEPNEIQTFTAKGFNQEGDEIGIGRVDWQSTTGGLIDDDGMFIGSYDIDTVDIITTVGDVRDVACVGLLPVLRSLEIEPQGTQLKPNEQLNLRVRGFNQFSNEVKIQNIHWQTTEGKIYPDGTFVAVDRDANITVSATVGNIKGTAHFKVIEPSRLTELVISPQQVVMNPGEWQHFEVMGFDQRGDAIAISGINWEATGGTIDHDAYYFTDSNQKGEFTITATIGRFSVSAHVSVPPVLRRLEIFPPQIQLEPEETKTFTVIGFDQQDSQMALEKVDWKSTKGGSISRQGLFQGGYSQREVTVTASVGNVRKLAYVTLLPILRRLYISPPAVHLKPNESQTFTVIGFDQFGDEIDPGAILWEASGGDIDQNGNFIVDCNAKGQFLVTATSHLTPKLTKKSRVLLFNVGISSKILSYFLRFLAQFQDELITESNSEDTSEVSSTITETEIDNFELELEAWITKTLIKLASRLFGFISSLCLNQATANLSASAEITVVPVLRHLEIYPTKALLKPYETINFTVKGLDQHCYEIDVNNVNWKATDGNINSHGTLSIDDKCSNVTITVTVETINSFAHVSIVKAPQNISRQNSPTIVDVKFGKVFDTKNFPSIQKNKRISNESLESDIEEKISNPKFEKLDLNYEYKYQCEYRLSSPHNYIDNCHRNCEKSSWFYRSQLYYDGFTPNEFSGDYNDYLSYQDEISYIEFLM